MVTITKPSDNPILQWPKQCPWEEVFVWKANSWVENKGGVHRRGCIAIHQYMAYYALKMNFEWKLTKLASSSWDWLESSRPSFSGQGSMEADHQVWSQGNLWWCHCPRFWTLRGHRGSANCKPDIGSSDYSNSRYIQIYVTEFLQSGEGKHFCLPLAKVS